MNSKYYRPIVLLRELSLLKRKIVLPFKLISSGFINSESYFPDLQRKSRFRIFGELLVHIIKYGSIEWHYFSYGFDIKGLRNQSEYLDDSWFLWKSSMLNTVLPEKDKTCILRDKQLFSDLLSVWGFDSPRIIGRLDGTAMDQSLLKHVVSTDRDYFFKPLDGQCGQGIIEVSVSEGECLINGASVKQEELFDYIRMLVQKGSYLIQERISQHPIIDALYDKSINTIRLLTVFDRRNNTVVPLSAVLRVGANGNVVDNWAAGGLAIGIDLDTGRLHEWGFYKHGKGTKTKYHPNSGVPFSGVEIPFWNEVITKAKALHHRLLPIFVIGWDIAITPERPVFIEGNDNMEVSINQEADKGLKNEMYSFIN